MQAIPPDDPNAAQGGGDFMSANDAGAAPAANDPSTDPNAVIDPNADPNAVADPNAQAADAGGGDFMSADDNATVGAATHGATMGGADAQHPGSDQMLTQDQSAVTPQEQHAYDDFVTRALLFMNDPRKPLDKNGKPNDNAKAPRDIIIDHLNIKGMPADVAVGRTTAQICWLIFSNAKHQGVDYPPDVVYHGADEVMSHVYEIGVKSGVIQNPPPPDSPAEQKLLGMAKMYATQFFGNNVIDSGLNNRKEAQDFYLSQIQREHDSGALDRWNPGASISPNQLSAFLARASQGKAALADMRAPPPSTIADFKARGHPTLVPSGGVPAPPQAPAPDDTGAAAQGGP